MKGVQNFLQVVSDNWTSILVCIGLIVGMIKKAKEYFSKSSDEQVEIAKKFISESMMKRITDAEVDYEEWNKAGSIKRSQVISQIYREYPILMKVVDQAALIAWVDSEIDSALPRLKEIMKANKKEA